MSPKTKAPPLELLPADALEVIAERLKLLAHPVRLRMIDILTQGEFIVNELAELCEVQPHQACEHLRLLKGHGLLSSERRGRTVYYSIEASSLPSLISCIRGSCSREGFQTEMIPIKNSSSKG